MKTATIRDYIQRKGVNYSHLEKWDKQVFINKKTKKLLAIIPLISIIAAFIIWIIITLTFISSNAGTLSFSSEHSRKIIFIICFLLSTTSLFLLYTGKERLQYVSRIFSVVIFVVAVFYISSYFVTYSTLLRPLISLSKSSNSFYFGSLSVDTEVGLLLLSIPLFLISFNSKTFIFFSQLFSFNLIIMIFLWIISRVVNNPLFHLANTSFLMIFKSAGCILVLGVGVFFLKPWDGIFSVLVMKSFGGIISRKLFPIVLFISVLFIWIQYIGFNSDILNNVLVVGVVLIIFISVLIYFVWKTVIDVNLLEKEFKEAGEDLRRANERFNLAADAAYFGIWDYDPRHKEVLWDDKLFEIYGIEKTPNINVEEVWRKSFHPEDLESGLLAVDRALKKGKNYYSEYRIIRPDGSLRYLKVIGKVVYDNDGEPLRMTGLMQDQTQFKIAKKEVVENERKYKYLFDETPVPIWIFNENNYRFLEVNNAALRNYGYSREEFNAMSYFDIHPKEDILRLKEILESGDTKKHKGIWRHEKKNGEIIYVDIKADKVEYGQHNARIVISNDITLQRNASERMRIMNNELEERVNTRTRQLQDSNRDLESFAYSVSHDLRAPLRHIIGFSQKLERHLGITIKSTETDRLTKKIKDSASKLGQLIDELLTFSRLGRTEINKISVHPDKIIQEVIEDYTIPFSEDKVEWVIHKLPEIQADLILLKSVFQNLINNALKFSEKKEKIRIEIGYKEVKNKFVFFVKDNGAGFSMEYADKLFGVFQRLHSNEDFPGTGIGLAMVRRIIKKHNGTTWAEGEENIGATFYFSLPKQ